ncbi:hypothetical protein [Ruminiclostridium papyrosolvens]|uniref:Uncharacterized protein n=1 Tax=Ruminiclostridium papyrosolvens C7 TaxID=1330534 RepID=U4R0D1_9FIRM|nr:hypothetical protein [Ruminiclostridium papyrosolvens]EPR11473.1 hypothetical protein L323_11710 [Ruminiclostridium papyrosolvens C7]
MNKIVSKKKIAAFSITVLMLLSVTLNCFAATKYISNYKVVSEQYVTYNKDKTIKSSYGYFGGKYESPVQTSHSNYEYSDSDGYKGVLTSNGSFTKSSSETTYNADGTYVIHAIYYGYFSGNVSN